MKQYPWLDEYLLSKPGAVKDYKAEWGWHRYMAGGKMSNDLLKQMVDDSYRLALAKLLPLISSGNSSITSAFMVENSRAVSGSALH